jgi:hypothetical protein
MTGLFFALLFILVQKRFAGVPGSWGSLFKTEKVGAREPALGHG